MSTGERVHSRLVAPGVRLHVVTTDRFTTTWCRVALVRDLGPEAAQTAILAAVLQATTARSRTREALAWRLAELHGASLAVATTKPGDAQLLVAALEWPTRYVTRGEKATAEGLALLREVLTEPNLDPALVARERENHGRSLMALHDDRARRALRRCLEICCAGEPYGLDALGRLEDLDAATPEALFGLHQRLIRAAPVEVYLVGDLSVGQATRLVGRHLLWPGRSGRIRRMPRIAAVRAARARPRRVVETDRGGQTRLALAWRAPIRPGSRLFPAALTLAGVLGGGSFGRLFKVVREQEGLCYDVAAAWHAPKGLLVVDTGVEASMAPRALRHIRALVREVAGGSLEPGALRGFRERSRSHVTRLRDDRAGTVLAHQEALLLGLDPSPRRRLQALEAVRPADVRRAGARLAADTVFVLRSEEPGA